MVIAGINPRAFGSIEKLSKDNHFIIASYMATKKIDKNNMINGSVLAEILKM